MIFRKKINQNMLKNQNKLMKTKILKMFINIYKNKNLK